MKLIEKILLVSFGTLLFACEKQEYVPESSGYELNPPIYFGEYKNRIPDDNQLTTAGFELGRKLFYEKKLSGDNTISCSSCHEQSKAFTDGAAVSLGINGAEGKVSSMSLVNLLWNEKFTWDGKVNTLEEQSIEPLNNPIEMHQPLDEAVEELELAGYESDFESAFGSPEITAERIEKALAQFQRALISDNSKYDQYLRGEYEPSPSEMRGIRLFFTHPEAGQIRGANCGDCHLGPLTSGEIAGFGGFHNNGLDTEQELDSGLMKVTGRASDKGRFKTPSLRNVAVTAPYMHDGRFATLEEVMNHYNEGVKPSSTLDILILEASNEVIPDENTHPKLFLTEQEKQDVIAFLHMLTDEEFLHNPEFSDPNKN